MTVFFSRLHTFAITDRPHSPGRIARGMLSRATVALSLLLAGLASGLAQAQTQAQTQAQAQAQAGPVALTDAAQETTTMVVVDM